MDAERRYSGYDEYHGIFGALGNVHTTDRGSSRSLSTKYSRNGRGFPSSRRSSTRRPGSGLTTNDYERREKYLRERQSKRRIQPTDGQDINDVVETTRPQHQQIWLPPKNFTFRQRAGRLDTRSIARLDLPKIVATTDVETIQKHLENIAFSDVTLEDVQQYSDAYFLKLFQIAQLTLEYLLNVQDSLATHCENLETQCEGLSEECQSLEIENNKVEGEITALQKEIRQKQSTLATFEVLLLNATAAKRAAQGLRAMQQQKLDQENDPAVLNILGTTVDPSTDVDESGAIPLVSSCVLCGKKFISPEYLVRHQHKKHSDQSQHTKKAKKKKTRESEASDSSRSESDSTETTKSKTQRAPKTTPLPVEVIQALNDRNELAKELMEVHIQLRSEKEKRVEEAKQAEQQQANLANQLTSYMVKLQDTLIEMEKKQEQSKYEMMRYTQEALERMKNERIESTKDTKKSHAGRLESDDDDSGERKKRTAPEDVEKRILDSLLRAQAEIHHKNSELEQANRKLQTKLRRKTRQLQMEPPAMTTLMSMTALDAQRYGVDPGLDFEDKPRPKPKAVLVEDKPVQTEEEQEVQPTKTASVPVLSTPKDTTPKPKPTPVIRQPPPPLKRAESKLPTISVPAVEPPKPVQPPTPKPEVKPMPTPLPAPKPELKVVEETKPPVTLPKESTVVVADVKSTEERETKPESKLQHAAHLVGKVALGFLTRRALQNSSNWLLTLPSESLMRALNDREHDNLLQAHGGMLQDVTVEIEDEMTANDLRVAFADALSANTATSEANDQRLQMDYHRILLHHRHTGQEISGDQFIYHLRNLLDVKIIPSFEAAEAHIDRVLSFHDNLTSQVRDIRRASIDIAPDELSLSMRIHTREDANEIAHRSATRIQSIVRRFLALRQLEMLKIDRLVEARLVAMRSLTSSPRSRTLSSARSRRHLSRSVSVAAIREEVDDEVTVTEKAEQIHMRLADLVKQKTGIDTRTRSAKWSRGQLSSDEYEHQVAEMEQNRKKLAPEVQQRITEIAERVNKLVEESYDPVVARQQEDQYVAASRIQLAVQVAVARKKLKQLLGHKDDSPDNFQPVIEPDKESVSSRASDKDSADEHASGEKDVADTAHNHEANDEDEADQLDVEELNDVDIKRLADAYEEAAEAKQPIAPRAVTPEAESKKPLEVEAKPKPELPPRAGTPPPSHEDLLGRSPRPKDASHMISPFSKTPLLSRRAPVTRRGSGYDNAR